MATSLFYRILHLTFSKSTVIIANMLIMIFASRYLSMQDYSTYRQTFLPYEILAPFLSLGIPPTIYYLLPRRKDKLNLVFHSILLILFCALVFSGFLMFGGAEFISRLFHNPELIHSVKWLMIYPFFQIPITLLISVYIFEGKTKFVGIYSSVFGLVSAISAIFVIISYRNYLNVVMIKAILPLGGFIFLLSYLFKIYKKKVTKKVRFFHSTKTILSTSIPFGFASMIGVISLQLDKVLVSSLGTIQEFAIYVNGAMEIPLIGVLTGSVSAVLIGELSKSIKDHDYTKALELFQMTAIKTALILFPIMVFFIFNAREFMILLYSEKYELSAIPFTIYLFLLPIRIVVFGSIFVAMGKSKLILYRSIFELLLNIVLSISMFNLFGLFRHRCSNNFSNLLMGSSLQYNCYK